MCYWVVTTAEGPIYAHVCPQVFPAIGLAVPPI